MVGPQLSWGCCSLAALACLGGVSLGTSSRQTEESTAFHPQRLLAWGYAAEGGLPSQPLAHREKVRNNTSKLKTFLSFSIEQWLLTGMELEQKWNVNPRGLGAWRGVGVGEYRDTEAGESLSLPSSHHPLPPTPLRHF